MRVVSMAGGVLLFAMLALAAAPAHAQSAAAAADSLFREGRAAAQRGEWEAAAKRFAESERLSPAAGTRLNLALAEEHLGRLVAAWEHARALLDQLPPSDERRAIAQALFDRLDPRVPRLTLEGQLPDGARVELDGLVLEASSLGVALPVEVGAHRVRVRASGRRDRALERSVAEGERATLAVAVGEPNGVAPPAASPSPPHDERSPSRSGFPRVLGFVALGVSGAALAGTAVTGVLAIQKKHDVDARCDASGCDQSGLDAARSGHTLATAATILGVVTGATLAAGVTILVVVRPERSAREAFVGLERSF